MADYPLRGAIYWVTLDPVLGSETRKTRPCIIISNNAQNKMSSRVIIAPITSKVIRVYPFEAKIMVNERQGKAMLDQIKTVDKQRLGGKICDVDFETMFALDKALKVALGLD